ncbi:DUF937 domain-containing protein [Dysgonomonas sp. 520]|uniref:DUF937 domain-containing protein n=1 Tax=Dysgonomonas sp. 520 TaxID=2302931 RepID=UPI0013D0C980|nr:DUF937 domain-containing protein [Dysgonomonas sp. 520]NDW10307.1 DUF937 domain-containing protein [Dysgonomonas sp. 520]
MVNVFDSLKGLINSGMISKAATMFGESDSKVSSSVSSIISGLLGVLLKNGNTPQIKNILDEAGNLNILSGVEKIFEDDPSLDQQKIGDDFLQHLLGDRAESFTTAVSNNSGISKVATNRLVSMLAPVLTGFLGKKISKDKWSMNHLLNELDKQKDSFAKYIPNELVKSFGLSSVLTSTPGAPREEKKKSSSWLWWLLLVLAILALFFVWRSCGGSETDKDRGLLTAPATTITQGEEATEPAAPATTEKVNTELVLPDGVKIQAYAGGIEDQIIKFLGSDEYKNADENLLKDKWFNFDNIEFLHGSSTELTPESHVQLKNIASILNNYQGTKIKIGGYTDKTGDSKVNQKISQERAETVRSILEKGGISASRLSAEGYGDKFAKYPADAPDSDRIKDRIIALRFLK